MVGFIDSMVEMNLCMMQDLSHLCTIELTSALCQITKRRLTQQHYSTPPYTLRAIDNVKELLWSSG
jgi:hypothetical protein